MRHYLEIRTTISPTPHFLRRIHYMAASIRQLGGKLADHEIVVSVGGNEEPENLYRTQPWSNLYPILWRWVDPKAYARHGLKATGRDRDFMSTDSVTSLLARTDFTGANEKLRLRIAELHDAVAAEAGDCGLPKEPAGIS